MTNRPIFHALAASLAACALSVLTSIASPAAAQVRSVEDIVQVRLLDGWRTDGGNHMTAIRITLAPGWKTYWRAPGEGGIPPRLRFASANGIEGYHIHWPRPEVFYANGMRSIGYRNDVILPLELRVTQSGAVEVDGQIELGVCQDICMPVALSLSALLPATGAHDPIIAAALSARPLTAGEAGAGAATCTITPISDGLRVEVQMAVPPTGNDEVVVMELPGTGVWVSEAVTTRAGGIVTAVADMVPPDAGPFALDRSALRLTVIGSQSAVELSGCSG